MGIICDSCMYRCKLYCIHDIHCFLFKVSYENLIEAFTSRSTFARGEMIFSPMSAVKAVDIRDAFVKGIYGRIFIWIVNKINAAIFTSKVCTLCIHVNKNTVQSTEFNKAVLMASRPSLYCVTPCLEKICCKFHFCQ